MSERTTIFFLHGLGLSHRLWAPVAAELGPEFESTALDLPGHGSEAGSSSLTVEETADRVLGQLAARAPRRWALVGHSMGGKIATLVAARAERADGGLPPPLALVLVSASPLSPEPMPDDVRTRMIGWAATGRLTHKDAAAFVDDNTAGRLRPELRDATVSDVRTVSRAAWLDWLERGSREDWSDATDPVRTPTLVVAGAEDGPLGVAAQRDLVAPAVNSGEVAVIADAAHLSPLERPSELAGLIGEHVRGAARRWAGLPEHTAALIASERVSARTRALLLDRLDAPPPGGVLGPQQRRTLGALVARVVPQRRTEVDIAARLEEQLAGGAGDGWRFAELPPDAEAWQHGLSTLEDVGFAGRTGAGQDELIEQIVAGELGSDRPGRLGPAQMTLWFEDVRAEATRCWLAHPATQALIGYDGFANGGDGRRRQGYQRIGIGEQDPWQQPLRARRSGDPS